MNTQNTQPAQSPIQVWIDDTGNHYAAQELSPGKIGFYVYRITSRDSYGTTDQGPDQIATQGLPIRFAVDYALTNHYFNADGLTWIEARELEAAARDQKPIPERSLANAISYPDRIQLDDDTREAIITLLTKRCRAETAATIRRRLQNPSSLKNYGIYDRLEISPRVSYCAGQDYPAELAEIRRLLIKN